MSRKLRLELEIVFYRQLLFGLLFVVEVPLVAWVSLSISRIAEQSNLLIGAAILCTVAMVFVILRIDRVHDRLLDELEDR